MRKLSVLLAASALTAITTVAATPAAAQQTTSGVEGTVRAASGDTISGAVVTVTDTRTGNRNEQTTGADGRFVTDGLPTGGPYTVAVVAPGYQGQTVNDIFLTLSGQTSFTFDLVSVSSEADAAPIIITGTAASQTQLAVGPGQSFSNEVLQTLPTITRDIRDFIRVDPRVNIQTSGDEVDRISCLGGNDRTNVFTVDGIAQADLFGLNGTPFASRNSLPLPFDAVKETAIEFAPFDVEYGAFTGCAINVVTQSGTNRFSGSAFFEYRDENFLGDTAGGEFQEVAEFSEKRFGATLGGPIIPDRLFFFAGYEELDATGIVEVGPTGLGFSSDREFVTEAQFNEFSNILSTVYNRDTGPIPFALDETNQRYFGRLDAYITDDQRIEATYQRLEEENVEPDLGGSEYSGLNSFELEGTTSDYYSAALFSNWTDRLSTEIRYSRAEVGDVQGPVGGGELQSDNPLTRIQVAVATPQCGTTAAPTLTAAGCETGFLVDGPGIFRSANQLDTTVDQVKAIANYELGNHVFTIGGEYNNLDVFNLFIVNATGTLYFNNFDDLRNGLISGGTTLFPNSDVLFSGGAVGADINATPSGDPLETAAIWNRQIYSAYVQDDWQVTDQLNLLLGVRGEFYSGSQVEENPNFIERYGFSNAFSFDDLDPVVLPRVAATYEFDNEGFFYNSRVTAGVGVFSGGDPAVWLSNAFTNNGFTTGLGLSTNALCASEPRVGNQIDVTPNGTFAGFPDCARAAASAQAAAGLGDTQSIDPDLVIPTVTRANLAFATRFGTGNGGLFDKWSLNVDYIYSQFHNPFNFVDLSAAPDIRTRSGGFAIDGRPIYASVDPTAANCNATLARDEEGRFFYQGLTAPCFSTGRDDEIILTNDEGYTSHALSFILRKSFDRGLFTEGGGGYVNFGYAYTDANERRTNDNSTATSGYDRTPAFDRRYPDVRPSTYATDHNFSVSLGLNEEFIDDLRTSVGLFFRATSGRPYSLVYGESSNRNISFQDTATGDFNVLAYIPTGVDDIYLSPLSDDAAVTEFIDFLEGSGCDYRPGRSITANSCNNDWFFDLDMRIAQDIPGPGRFFGIEDSIELYATMDNVLNFIDGDWNALRTFGTEVGVIEGGVDTNGLYVINDFRADRVEPLDDNEVRRLSSTWRLKLGARYEF